MSDKNSERLDAWIFFNDGMCDEYKQLFVDDIKDLKQKLQAAEEKEKILREAVEFYADITNWSGVKMARQDFNTTVFEMNETDGCTMNIGGVKARQTLEKVGGGE